MTALPEITPHDEHKAKLIANVYPADGSSCSDTPSPDGVGS